MRSYFGTAITQHIGRTPEGYLICRDVIVSRTATREPIIYKESEVQAGGGDDKVRAWRRPETVFDPASMASLEGKPVCSPHPGIFLSPQNVMAYQKGVVLNVHRGPVVDDEETLMADLLITDQGLIDAVLAGRLRECSVGYECQYVQVGDDWEQRQVRANHLAVIPQARVGSVARIYDSDLEERNTMTHEEAIQKLHKITALLEREHKQTAQPTETTDSDELSAVFRGITDEAQAFADAARRFHRKAAAVHDCRPQLRIAADEKRDERQVMDELGLTPEQDAAQYSDSMKAFHRK
jgi:hypothetical protein